MMFRIFLVCSTLLVCSTAEAKFSIDNVKAAFGEFGPVRDSDKYYPMDEVTYRYTMKGVKTNSKNQVEIDINILIKDAGGIVLLDKTDTTKGTMALGGDAVPGVANVTLGNALKPGKYHLIVKATDKIGRASDSFEKAFSLLAPAFTSVAQRFFLDAEGKAPTGTSGIAGQRLYYKIGLIGMDRSKDKIDTTMEVELLDKGGKQVHSITKTSFKNDNVKEVKKISVIDFDGFVALNRPGAFTLRFKFTDAVGGQKSEIKFPLDVREP